MIKPINLRVDYSSIEGNFSNKIISSPNPVISWGGYSDICNDIQTAYRVVVKEGNLTLWDTGVVKSDKSAVRYAGHEIPLGRRIDFSVYLAGSDGVLSLPSEEYFYLGSFKELPSAKWIYSSIDEESVVSYFSKEFTVDSNVENAVLYVSAMGYCGVRINGIDVDSSRLNPPLTDYNKTCYYVTIPELHTRLKTGLNNLNISLADGWRRNWGDYLRIYNNNPSFFGTPCIWAALRLDYADGSQKWIVTDETWKCGRGNIVLSHLFDGETYDAGAKCQCTHPVEIYENTPGKLKPLTLPGVNEHKVFEPFEIYVTSEGKYMVDFGTNMSGVVRIKLPPDMEKGSKITIRHGQILYDDGTLNTESLRGAACEDTYIFSGDENDLEEWQPYFTYHGFRYAEVTGYPLLQKEDICAVMLCTNLEPRMHFHCGSPVVNALHKALVQTDRSTTHGATNDTCGRSERMYWLDDGVNRYPGMARYVEVGKIFKHLMMLIRDTQNPDGSITCTAPHIYGRRPGDPLSSSYLMLAEELYYSCGNTDVVEEFYPGMCAWEQCLLDNSTDYIMNYSYYGDWAGPEYSRDKTTMGGGAGSATIPAVMVGTGFLIHNARLLKNFARILGKKEDEVYYGDLYQKAKQSFLNKWYDAKNKIVYNGSQSCHALALWLDVIPTEDETAVAKHMRDDLVNSGYRFTTGAFCLRFMCDMLVKFGYIDEFYELMSREEYPSLGYMLQCGATTGWEKYEYRTDNSMNAHTHVLQISVLHCFYKHIGGIVIGDDEERFTINPHYPSKMHTLSMTQSTVWGDVSVRWRRTDGKINLMVNVPFNNKAKVCTPDGIKIVGSGMHTFVWEETK